MGKTIMGAVVSLDGFIADDQDRVGPLFDWYGNGDVAWSFEGSDDEVRTTQASADFMRAHYENIAVVVIGRRLFDLTNGWDGKPPANTSSWSPMNRLRAGSMPARHRSRSSTASRRPSGPPRAPAK
jgi:dihydrofolate reductase